MVDPDLCNSCGLCLKPGHCVAVTMEEKAQVDPEKCIGCSICVNLCPKKAIRMETS
jgi:TPP-dependent indolepyruvate ferredoxin oxidoreductase alpha subunit